jgi:hypothetical protein
MGTPSGGKRPIMIPQWYDVLILVFVALLLIAIVMQLAGYP